MKNYALKLLYATVLLSIVIGGSTKVYSQNIWLQEGDFPGIARTSATSFAIGYKIYVVGGFNYAMSQWSKEVWKYSPEVSAIDDIGISQFPNYVSLNNYPNPFNPTTTNQFQILVASKRTVKLQIYDVTGKLIKTLINENMEAGYHSITWNGKDDIGCDVPSGLYFYRIDGDNFHLIKQCLLLK